MGDCRISDFDKFKERYGVPACIMGMARQYPEDEEVYKELKRNLAVQYAEKLALWNGGSTWGRIEFPKRWNKNANDSGEHSP